MRAFLIVVALLIALLSACADPQCWANHDGPRPPGQFDRDVAECKMVGDNIGGHIEGGMAGGIAAGRRFGFCMESKGYYRARGPVCG